MSDAFTTVQADTAQRGITPRRIEPDNGRTATEFIVSCRTMYRNFASLADALILNTCMTGCKS